MRGYRFIVGPHRTVVGRHCITRSCLSDGWELAPAKSSLARSVTVIRDALPEGQRNRAVGIWAMGANLGMAAALLGGGNVDDLLVSASAAQRLENYEKGKSFVGEN